MSVIQNSFGAPPSAVGSDGDVIPAGYGEVPANEAENPVSESVPVKLYPDLFTWYIQSSVLSAIQKSVPFVVMPSRSGEVPANEAENPVSESVPVKLYPDLFTWYFQSSV